MANEAEIQNEIGEPTNDLVDLTNGRIDNLAALITVTSEQLDDRARAESAIEAGAGRTEELIGLVFGGAVPSVENYLAARDDNLVAA